MEAEGNNGAGMLFCHWPGKSLQVSVVWLITELMPCYTVCGGPLSLTLICGPTVDEHDLVRNANERLSDLQCLPSDLSTHALILENVDFE